MVASVSLAEIHVSKHLHHWIIHLVAYHSFLRLLANRLLHDERVCLPISVFVVTSVFTVVLILIVASASLLPVNELLVLLRVLCVRRVALVDLRHISTI